MAVDRLQPSPEPGPARPDPAPRPVLGRFPLVARPRLACEPLDTRLREISELAASARRGCRDPAGATAMAFNKAALVASDCGMSDLARDLCRHHHGIHRAVRPWTSRRAHLALEPLVNLARLHIRAGAPDLAVAHLERLFDAVSSCDKELVDDGPPGLNGLSRGSEDHRTLCRWMWGIVLSDGMRALAAAGRWSEAMSLAERHRGIGLRLLDGRQAAILAHVGAGDHRAAERLIEQAAPEERWEHTVAACLRAVNRGSGAADATDQFLSLRMEPRFAVFAVRVGLAVVDLAGGRGTRDGARAADHLRAGVAGAADAYVAREILDHPGMRDHVPPHERCELYRLVRTSGLRDGVDRNAIAEWLLRALDLDR